MVNSRRKNRTKGELTPGCSSHHASGMITSICVSRNEDQLLTCAFFLGADSLFGFSLDCDGVSSTYDAQALQKMCQPGVRPPTGVLRYCRRFRCISERRERRGGYETIRKSCSSSVCAGWTDAASLFHKCVATETVSTVRCDVRGDFHVLVLQF